MNDSDKAIRKILKANLNTNLKDFLTNNNFIKKGSFTYYRINNLFVEVVWIQLGQWNGGKFYLHYSKELLCNIFREDMIYGGNLSKRIDHGSNGLNWLVKTKKDVLIQVDSLINEIERVVLPYFKCINNIEKFIIENISLPNKSSDEILLATAFCHIKKFDKSWWICEDYKALIEDKDFDKQEIIRIKELIKELQTSIDENLIDALLKKWSGISIKKICGTYTV